MCEDSIQRQLWNDMDILGMSWVRDCATCWQEARTFKSNPEQILKSNPEQVLKSNVYYGLTIRDEQQCKVYFELKSNLHNYFKKLLLLYIFDMHTKRLNILYWQ